jgi:diguanylate cyclase (GGDEF)-like protein
MDWTTLPDLVCVTLLICAFASISRNSHTPQTKVWLIGWVLVAMHFGMAMFANLQGLGGNLGAWADFSALNAAGILFVWAAVPYRQKISSRWILAVLLGSSTLYLGLITMGSPPVWVLDISVALIGVMPLGVTLLTMRRFQRPERWVLVGLYCALAVFGLVVQSRPDGPGLTLTGLLVTTYLCCCIMFWFAYRRWTTGSFITIVGFLAWSQVFVVGTLLQDYWPHVHVESEVWNLPKYVVAIGMILLMLEDQIAHNRHLALHDELTGLPNRRLFHDRLENALNRAQRNGSKVALLLIDLDNFKLVNDAEGHHVGDEVLKQASSIFLTRIRISDTVARTGGDEFSVILEGPITRPKAEEVAASLKLMLTEGFEVAGRPVQIGASIGLAMYPEDAVDPESLRVAADLGMYAEKNVSRERRRDGGFSALRESMRGPLG